MQDRMAQAVPCCQQTSSPYMWHSNALFEEQDDSAPAERYRGPFLNGHPIVPYKAWEGTVPVSQSLWAQTSAVRKHIAPEAVLSQLRKACNAYTLFQGGGSSFFPWDGTSVCLELQPSLCRGGGGKGQPRREVQKRSYKALFLGQFRFLNHIDAWRRFKLPTLPFSQCEEMYQAIIGAIAAAHG